MKEKLKSLFKLKTLHCPGCKKDFPFDINKIPVGKRFEARCPKCGTRIMMIRKE